MMGGEKSSPSKIGDAVEAATVKAQEVGATLVKMANDAAYDAMLKRE
jgi:hypothetical protein